MEELNSSNNLSLYIKYATRDLVRSYRKIISIIVTLFISLFILSSILTIEDSLETELRNNSKLLLGGDLEIDYNRVEGNLKLVEEVKTFATVSQMVEFSTMISTINKSNNKSSFTRVKSIDANYPLYGEVKFEPKDALKKLNEINNTILVNENIFKNLNLKINDIIKATVNAPPKLPKNTNPQFRRICFGVTPGRCASQASGVSTNMPVNRSNPIR